MHMDRCGRRLRALSVTCLVSGVFSLSASTALAAPNEPSAGAEAPALQSPETLRGEADAPPSGDAAPDSPAENVTSPTAPAEDVPAPTDDAAVPEAPAEPATPGDPIEAPPTSEEADSAPQNAQPDPAEAEGEIAPDLLGGETEEIAPVGPRRPTTLRPQVEDPGAREAALRRAYEAQVRPPDNPGRLNLGVRLLFANAGGQEDIGGRMGGAQVDVGQSWNNFGYALTTSAWAGRVFLPRETGAEMNAMFGAGPTVSLGRRALLHRGYLDLRLGYDVLYGVVNRRRDDPTVVAPQSDPDVALEQADNLIPHGPRATLNMGLMGPGNHRKYFHGFGVTVGYQGLVHSFRGDLPFTHMLTMGLSYWMG